MGIHRLATAGGHRAHTKLESFLFLTPLRTVTCGHAASEMSLEYNGDSRQAGQQGQGVPSECRQQAKPTDRQVAVCAWYVCTRRYPGHT